MTRRRLPGKELQDLRDFIATASGERTLWATNVPVWFARDLAKRMDGMPPRETLYFRVVVPEGSISEARTAVFIVLGGPEAANIWRGESLMAGTQPGERRWIELLSPQPGWEGRFRETGLRVVGGTPDDWATRRLADEPYDLRYLYVKDVLSLCGDPAVVERCVAVAKDRR